MGILKWEKEGNTTVHRSGVGKTMEKINEILANPTEGFQNDIDHLLTRILAISARKITPEDSDQKLVFDGVCHFLNTAFANINIKKFYNTAPNILLKDYDHLSLGEKVVHNIYGKERKLFYKDIVTGANCHHRTIILDELFDKLLIAGLKIKKKIVLYSDIEGHSFLVIEFQGIQYIADVFGENDRIGQVISPLRSLQSLPKSPLPDKLSFLKTYDKSKSIQYFDNRNDFTEHLTQKPSNNIKIIFRPKIDESNYKEIEIIINNEAINCTIGDKSYKLFIQKWLVLPKKLHKTEVIDYIIQHTTGDQKAKQEIGKYITMIRKKINPQKIYNLFSKK